MKKYKTVFDLLFILAIFFAILHFVFLGISAPQVDVGSMVMNLIPYGLPVLVFASARRACANDKPRWSRSGFFSMALFALSFLAMSIHVTIAFFYANESFINIYFNLPIIYSVPLLLFAILWLGTKKVVAVRGEAGILGKLITASPAILLVAMIIHVASASIMEIIRQTNGPLMTSAPWWVTSLLVSFAYIAAMVIALLVRAIYIHAKKI